MPATLPYFTNEQLVTLTRFNSKDLEEITKCRQDHNRLGFGYQLAFVRLSNRFPSQQPFEVLENILTFTSIQLSIPSKTIASYGERQPTISEHQEKICRYLGLRRFGEEDLPLINRFLLQEACRLEQTNALLIKAEQFLKEQGILTPSESTLRRVIASQQEEARRFIFRRITDSLPGEFSKKLDALLDTKDKRFSEIHLLKQTPGRASPPAMLRLADKIRKIKETGILRVNLSWLNNNFQRSFTRYVRRCKASRIRELQEEHRYAVIVCFLWQVYRDSIDFMVDMYNKLINRIYNSAQDDIDNYTREQQSNLQESLLTFAAITDVILDDSIDDSALRHELFGIVGRESLQSRREEVKTWLSGKYSHVFNMVVERFSYIRQFSPSFIEHITLQPEDDKSSSLIKACEILRELNSGSRRKLPEDAPVDFIPRKIRKLITTNGEVKKSAWECALLTAIRDEIKTGNLSVEMSKHFSRIDDFFIPHEQWNKMRDRFFRRAGLPIDPEGVKSYLTERLNRTYDTFLEELPENSYVNIDETGWHLSVDASEKPDSDSEKRMRDLEEWLSINMRMIKLPDLLIEVDNELKFTRHFMSIQEQEKPTVEDICAVLTTIMAQGCNIGPYTMSHLVRGISYERIKHIDDWMLTDEALHSALALVVNAISRLDITQVWGEGKTSSSDGQRFALRRKVIQQTYSPKFNDFALEFYSFVADNYAPFYSIPIECAVRDAPYVLDGLLYNESDLPLEEHYTDTHGYTEINFAAFAMLGRKFCPRIRGLHKQRIYRIDKNKDHGPLNPLVNRTDRTIHLDWICDQWDRMGHFYASLESGHTTASVALRRLNGYDEKNHFYRANRELGRVYKTEHNLKYMSDRTMRQRTRRGLLKVEQIHALARDLNYGKRGRISRRDFQEQKASCSCLTLLLACIIYWQAKEINRVVTEHYQESSHIDLSLMEHISPITWENVILYGEYVLNRSLIRLEKFS